MPYSFVDGTRTFGSDTAHRLYLPHLVTAPYMITSANTMDTAYPLCCSDMNAYNRARMWVTADGASARSSQASRYEIIKTQSASVGNYMGVQANTEPLSALPHHVMVLATADDGSGDQRWVIANQGGYYHIKVTYLETEYFLSTYPGDADSNSIRLTTSDDGSGNQRWHMVTHGGYTTFEIDQSIMASQMPALPASTRLYLTYNAPSGYMGVSAIPDGSVHSSFNYQPGSERWTVTVRGLGSYYHIKPYISTLEFECRFFKTVQKNLLGLTVEATPPAAATVITSAQPATTSAPLWRLCSSTNAQAMLGAGTLRNEVEAGVHSFAQCEALATALGVPFDPYFGIDTCTTVDYAALGNTLVCGYWAPAQFSTHGCGTSSYSNTGAVIPFPVGRSRNGATLWSQIAEHGGIGDSQYGGTCPDLVGGTGCRLPFGGTAFGLSVYPASGAWCYQSDSSLDYFAHTIPLLNPDVRRLYSMYPMENAPPPPSPPHGPPPPSSPHMPHCLNPRDGTANTRIALSPEASGTALHTTNGVAGAIFSVQNAQIYEFTTTEAIYFSTDATFVTETAEPCTLEVGYYSSGSFVSISQSQYGPNDAPLSSGSVSARTPYTNEDGGCNNLEGDQSQCCAASDTSAAWNGQPCQWRNDGPVGCEPQSVYVSAGTAFSCPDRFWAFRTTSACADGTAIKLNAVGQNILNRGIVFYIVNTCPADTADPPPPPSRRKRMLVEEGREGKVEPFIRRKLMKGLSGKNKRM